MTKPELQAALAEATLTDKKTAGALLAAFGAIAYKAVKKEGEFALPGFGKRVKQKRAARQTLQTLWLAAEACRSSPISESKRGASFGPVPGKEPNGS